jgi:hypothetical protein
MEHIGIDLGKTSSQIYMLTEDSKLIERRNLCTFIQRVLHNS